MGSWAGSTYTASYTDTKNNKLDAAALEHQIRYSHSLGLGTIKTTSLNYLNDDTSGLQVHIHFWSTPTETEKLVVANVVAQHSGQPLDRNVVKIDMPVEPDGRLLTTPTPAPLAWSIVYTSHSDDLTQYEAYVASGGLVASGRFDGPSLRVVHPGGATGPTDYVDGAYSYAEVVLVHDGELHWESAVVDGGDWSSNDWVSVGVRFPASEVTSGGAANATLVELAPSSGAYKIVPVEAGTGTHEVTKHVPIPVSDRSANTGYWTWDFERGPSVTPNRNGDGTHDLYLFQTPDAWFMAKVLCAGVLRSFLPDAYRVEAIHPNWLVLVRAYKASTGAGVLVGRMTLFRKHVV